MSEIRSTTGAPGARILSVGSYRPRRVVDNDEIATMIETTDEWIRQRTGIRERRWAGDGETLVDMSEAASRQALERAGMSGADVDMVIVATCTSLSLTPTTANLLQDRLGATAGALEVNSACAGFCYALGVANDLVRGGSARHVLVVGAERMSELIDPADRGTVFIFADGAGAVVVGPSEEPGIGPVVWGSQGEHADALDTQPLATDYILDPSLGRSYLRMQGQSVFRWAVSQMPAVATAALEAAGVKVEQLGAFVPHQANTRIVDVMAKGFGLPEHVAVADDIRTAGNTSSASVPLAIDALLADGRARSGDLALLVGFGGGLSHAAQVVALP